MRRLSKWGHLWLHSSFKLRHSLPHILTATVRDRYSTTSSTKSQWGWEKNSKKKIQTFFQSWTSRGDLEDTNVTMMLFSVDFLSQEEIVRVSVAAARSRESLKVLEFYSDIMWFSAAFHCPYKKTMERKKQDWLFLTLKSRRRSLRRFIFVQTRKNEKLNRGRINWTVKNNLH